MLHYKTIGLLLLSSVLKILNDNIFFATDSSSQSHYILNSLPLLALNKLAARYSSSRWLFHILMSFHSIYSKMCSYFFPNQKLLMRLQEHHPYHNLIIVYLKFELWIAFSKKGNSTKAKLLYIAPNKLIY